MSQEVVIGIAVGVVVLVIIKVWVFNIVKFKIDESTIVKYFKESGLDNGTTTGAIASATGIGENRVKNVCVKSSLIHNVSEGWRLL